MGTNNIPKRNTQLNLADIGEQTKTVIPEAVEEKTVTKKSNGRKPVTKVNGKKGTVKNDTKEKVATNPPVTKKPDVKCKPKNFVQALIYAREKIGAVGKESQGWEYKYASLDQLFSKAIPALAEAGLFVTQSCKSIKEITKKVTTTTKKHPDGNEITTVVSEEIPEYSVCVTTTLMWEGGKETIVNNGERNWSKSGKPQDIGSCDTYAKRYDMLSILSVFPTDSDQIKELQTAIRDDDGQRVQNL